MAWSIPAIASFLSLLRDGYGWVKLTGPYRISAQERFPYDDVTPFVQAVVEAAPDRVIWGSDWPHVMLTRPMPNDGDLLDVLPPGCRTRPARRILVNQSQRYIGRIMESPNIVMRIWTSTRRRMGRVRHPGGKHIKEISVVRHGPGEQSHAASPSPRSRDRARPRQRPATNGVTSS